MNIRKLMLAVSALALASCTTTTKPSGVPALDLSNLDTLTSPSEDFYQYAAGGWQKANPLKPEYARYGSFDRLNEVNQERLNDLFKGMADMKPEVGSTEDKIVILYKQGMDSLTLNSQGAQPVARYVNSICSIKDKSEIIQGMALMHDSGVTPFFGSYVDADLTDSGTQILYLYQGGLGIGDRDYYVDPSNSSLKADYQAFLSKVLALAGIGDPDKAAANAVAVEDKIAEYSWTSVQRRDVVAGYNPMSTEELAERYPGFDFKAYFAARNIPPQKKLVVSEPSYFEGMSKFFASADLQQLKDYLLAQLITEACSALSDDFYKASFDFFSARMSGIMEEKPRWKRAMSVPNGVLGEAVGKMYVERYFPEESKAKMVALVENLKIALSQHIDSLDWMGDQTKAKAQEKLASFTVKIGYPDKWKDYSSLSINKYDSYFENIISASRWFMSENKAKLGKPTDKTEWGMTPQTVNAYYNPTTNEICFPAAILQPPFFNPDADNAVNYGGIGVVIGHEMSHGFDDQGRQFDKDGNMSNWWTDEDAARFNEKAEVLVKQFDAIEILPGLNANGRLSLGENIGDHGGLSIAFTAMRNANEGTDPGLIDGFTPEQRFFLSYGAIWAQNITDEEKARLTKLDVHSLAKNRVNASLKNFQQFFDAFGIKDGDPMWMPESERVHIW